MSLRRNLKTYLIAAVLLLMGGLAVGTVATASQPSSYLGIRKFWEMPKEDKDKLVNGQDITVIFEIDYYNLDGNGNYTTEKPYTDTVYMKYNKQSDEWFIQKKFDGMIEVVAVREITEGGNQGDVTIPGIEKLGEYLLTEIKEEWKEGKEIYQCGDEIRIQWGFSDLLVLEKTDIADGDSTEYQYKITSDKSSATGFADKTVTLSKEHPRAVVQVLGLENNTVVYKVNETGGGNVTLKISEENIPGDVIKDGVFMPAGSAITVHAPGSVGDNETYEFYIYSVKSWGDSYECWLSIDSGESKTYYTNNWNDGEVYKVVLDKVVKKEAAECAVPVADDETDSEKAEDAGLTEEEESAEPDEAGTADSTEAPSEETSEGENKDETAPEGDAGTTEIADGTVPLTNGESVEKPAEDENKDTSATDPAEDENKDTSATDPTEDENKDMPAADPTEDKEEDPADTPSGDENKEKDTSGEEELPANDNAEEIMLLAEEPAEGAAFTVDYSCEITGAYINKLNIVRRPDTKVSIKAEANGAGSTANSWSYKILRDDAELGMISVGAEKTLADALQEANLGDLADGKYSIQPVGGCTITYYNPGVKFTNIYEIPKIGAYNVVHEYYEDEAMTKLDGKSAISIKEDNLDKEVTGKEVDKVLKFGDYTYKYKAEAYGIGDRKEGSEEESPDDSEDASMAAERQSETEGDNVPDKNGWKPVDEYEEDPEKGNAVVKEDGSEVIILKYVRETEPEDPKEDPKDPKDPKDPDDPDEPDLPDPNDPESPPTVTITDDDVPRTYVRVWDPQKEEWVYLPEDEVPLAGRTSAKTADGMAPVFWMFMTGLSVAGVATFRYSKKKKEE